MSADNDHGIVDLSARVAAKNTVDELIESTHLRAVIESRVKYHYEEHQARHLAHYHVLWDAFQSSIKETISFGRSALTVLVAINGGAAVALLALMGYVVVPENNIQQLASPIFSGITMFVTGLVLSAIATMLSYVSQYLYSIMNWRDLVQKGGRRVAMWIGLVFHIGAIACAIASLVVFCAGAWQSGQRMLAAI